jgi:predicted SAM-dependent methyltransferase
MGQVGPKKIEINISWTGETAKIEEEALKYITPAMNGIDIGSGGSPILLQAISVDCAYPGQYSDYVHLKGDARKLVWFKDMSLDYVFSSHCFEDFDIKEKTEVFKEWLRVLKLGGLMLLYLPDEQVYRKYCEGHNQHSNSAHKDEYFNIGTVRSIAQVVGMTEEVAAIDKHGDYCFFIVFRRIE